MNLPDRMIAFHQKHRWLSHAAFWTAYLLFSVGSSKYHDGKEGTYSFEFISDGLYIFAEMVAAYALAYLVIPAFLQRRQYVMAGFGFLLVCYGSCVLARIFIVKICEPLVGMKPKASETYLAILTDMPKLLYVYLFDMLSVAGLFVLLKVIKDQLLIQKRALLLEKEKAETELKLLKAQLNPHFLFNTLNNIYSLSFISAAKTSESIARLADILDHILYRGNHAFVPVSAEIAVMQNYIELEKLRYDNRLTVHFRSEVEEDVPIAPLMLLSLVENAFKHGASEDAGAPEIDIRLTAKRSAFEFYLSNSVAGGRGEEGGAAPKGIGLTNLRRQLGLVYGKAHELSIEQDEHRFTVRLSIHYKPDRAGYEKNKVFAGG